MKSVKQINSHKNPKSSIQRQKTDADGSTSRINSYFKPAPKSLGVENGAKAKADQTKEPKLFYIQALKEKLQAINGPKNDDLNEMDGPHEAELNQRKDLEDSLSRPCSECEQKNKDLMEIQAKYEQLSHERDCEQKRSIEWQDKYKELKKVYVNLTVTYAELDLKNKDLLKTVTGKKEKNGASTADKQTDDNDILTSGEVKFLDCMPLDKKKDSTFVLQCLQFLYKNDPKIMASKSVKGTKESIRIAPDGAKLHIPGKQPLTPTKYNRIRELFIDRISKCGINSAEYGERIKEAYVNKLLASGIKNMSK